MDSRVDERITDTETTSESPATSNAAKVVKAPKLSSLFQWIRRTKIINKQTCKVTVALILVIWITNPQMIPFLPANIKERLTQIAENLWGEVETIKDVLPISWVKFFQIIVMAMFLCLIAEIVKTILTNISFRNKRIRTFVTVFLSTMQYSFAIVGLIWALRIMGIDTSIIFAGVGIVSLVVGFSADSLIADIVTGAFILFDNEYNVGDIIDVGTFHGEVLEVKPRSTLLRDQGGNIKIINNSNMRDVINRSKERSRAVCDITVPAKLDLQLLEDNINSLLKSLENEENVFLESPEYWGVESLKGQEMVLRIVAWVDEHNVYRAQRIINHAIKLKFQELNVWG